MNPNASLIDSGWKFVASVSGGGQEIFGELTRHGQMSSTFLEGLIPYSVPAFEKLIEGKPDQIVSAEAARAAAMVCYRRAMEYCPGDRKVFGFASTGSVVKVGGEREGRKHKVFMAVQDFDRTLSLSFDYAPGRTRGQEEELTANCIKVALNWGCHIFDDMRSFITDIDTFSMESCIATTEMAFLVHGIIPKVKATRSGAIFSSSCNPLHDGHLNIIEDASKRLDCPVDIELCVKNADKPPLDYLTIKKRIESTEGIIKDNPHVGHVIPTNKPLFFDKATIFPGAVFVVGMDTYDRIFDPKYYEGEMREIDHRIDNMEDNGNSFLVYPRKGYTAKDLNMSYPLTKFIGPCEGYESSDISSTQIRKDLRNAES